MPQKIDLVATLDILNTGLPVVLALMLFGCGVFRLLSRRRSEEPVNPNLPDWDWRLDSDLRFERQFRRRS